MLITASLARTVIGLFIRLGVFGPFFIEALNTSFFYVPLANEFLLFALISSDGGDTLWPVYALMGATGSAVGAFLLDLVVRRAGEKGIEKLVRPKRFARLKQNLEAHAGRVIFVAAALPPPFPFRVTLMAASALQSPRGRMLAAVFFGRVLRFTAEALLILYLGRGFLRYMNSDAVEYAVYAFTMVAIVGSVYTIYKLFVKK
jgi:membrane protein YqaA with SNARE-associated domain